jgi:hypothetical protein
MTIAQAQPLNIPTASELTKAHDFLHEADLLVTDVKSLFRNSGDFVIAARLKDIQGRLADEIRVVERLIAASKLGFCHSHTFSNFTAEEISPAAGYDPSQAKKMLEQFLEQQALHIADRDRLIKELSESPPSL